MGDDERDEMLEQMGRLARQAFSDGAKATVSAAGKRQLKLALAAARPARRVGRWVAVSVAALVTFVAVVVYRLSPQRLAYEIDGTSPGIGGYLQGTRQRPAVAHFTDGTEVRVNGGARARIVDVDTHGARIALEQGRAHLRVVHRPEARWSVEAGPFSITVTGTEFDADWSASDGMLVVEMRSGAVIVRGPLAGDGIGVHAGQRLVASVPESKLHIEPLDAQASAAPDSVAGATPATTNDVNDARDGVVRDGVARDDARDGVVRDGVARDDARLSDSQTAERRQDDTRSAEPRSAAEATDVQDERPPTTVTPPPGRPDGKGRTAAKEHSEGSDVERSQQPMSWAKRVSSGDFRSVIADAETNGLGATLAEAPLSDLVALADAARYTGNTSIARDALLSQRRRYPTSADAKAAAFLLGRIADDKGAAGEAIDWYERYLSEAPRGAFAAEALGREMLAAKRGRGAALAASVAQRYLDRFPGGPYADRARTLAAGP